ncbi:MAG: transcriptional regulator [Proteobacteria bacterium]|nr:transcriptional regulator [Pseudomonadota bacterium]MDA1057661.1 transcriptional regulator [Pseudomonadota bacterium]
MSRVTINVESPHDAESRLRRAFSGEAQGNYISFASVDLLWKIVTPKRWEIIRVMTGAGPVSIREVSRRVARDVKSVHGDVQALLRAGVLDRDEGGRIVFPYDEVHVDFVVRAA